MQHTPANIVRGNADISVVQRFSRFSLNDSRSPKTFMALLSPSCREASYSRTTCEERGEPESAPDCAGMVTRSSSEQQGFKFRKS